MEILSGPSAWEFFRALMACAVFSMVNGGSSVESTFRLCIFFVIILFCCMVGLKLILE